jgi:hypothetical protein
MENAVFRDVMPYGFFPSWWKSWYVFTKRRFLQVPHGITSQNTALFFSQYYSIKLFPCCMPFTNVCYNRCGSESSVTDSSLPSRSVVTYCSSRSFRNPRNCEGASMLNSVRCYEDAGNAGGSSIELWAHEDAWSVPISFNPGECPLVEVCDQLHVPVSTNPRMSFCMDLCVAIWQSMWQQLDAVLVSVNHQSRYGHGNEKDICSPNRNRPSITKLTV